MKLTKKLITILLMLCLSFSLNITCFSKTDATTAASDSNWNESSKEETEKAIKILNEQIKVMEKVFDTKTFDTVKDKDVIAYATTMNVKTKNVKIPEVKSQLVKSCGNKLKELIVITKVKDGKKTSLELLKEVKKTKTSILVDLMYKASKK